MAIIFSSNCRKRSSVVCFQFIRGKRYFFFRRELRDNGILTFARELFISKVCTEKDTSIRVNEISGSINKVNKSVNHTRESRFKKYLCWTKERESKLPAPVQNIRFRNIVFSKKKKKMMILYSPALCNLGLNLIEKKMLSTKYLSPFLQTITTSPTAIYR